MTQQVTWSIFPKFQQHLDPRGLAVWYGDDGSYMGSYARWGKGKAVLYNKSLRGEARERVIATFERLGLGRPRDDGRGFLRDQGLRAPAAPGQYEQPGETCDRTDTRRHDVALPMNERRRGGCEHAHPARSTIRGRGM